MVFEKLVSMAAEILEKDEEDITPETLLTKAAGVEALQLAKLVMECEGKFKIIIHDEEVHTFTCVKDLVIYIEKALSDV